MNAKLIAAVGLCFILGATGGTVMQMRTVPEEPAEHAAEAATDSTAGDTAHAAETAHADASGPADTPAAAPAGEPRDTAKPATPASAPADRPVQDSATAAPEPAQAQPEPDQRAQVDSAAARLARIFGAMRPEEAARLLEPLPEGDVRAVLFALSDRKAAAILANFKGERATALARALLQHAGAR